MRGYSVRVYSGRDVPPEMHWIEAASDEAAAERAEQLLAESPEVIGVEVMRAGERLYVRGIVPAATASLEHTQRLASEQRDSLWKLMQRIERSRYRAELAEAKTAEGSAAFRAEMAEIAQEWRDLARHIEAEGTAPTAGVAPVGEAGAPRPPIRSVAPSERVSRSRQWPGVVAGLVVGALGALALSTPRWIEASTGVDLDRGSGGLERGVAVVVLLAAVVAAFAMRASSLRSPAKIDHRNVT